MLAMFFACIGAVLSNAQAIRDICTNVYLFPNGQGFVEQTWDVSVVSGTEWYIPIDNPGKSYIHDLRVFENGEEYANDGRNWNSDRSLAAKTRRCGIVEKGGGSVELCWGQGPYGDHVYTIYYKIDNLVLSYPECDGFHWHFLNDEWSVRPRHASITFINKTGSAQWFWNSSDDNNFRFWGFGMVGDSWIEDGKICFESTEPLQYSSFFSALISFDKGLFSPEVEGDGTFEDLKEEARKGSDYGDEDEKMGVFDWIAAGIMILLLVGLPLLIVGYLIYLLIRRIYRKVSGNRYDKKVFGKSKIDGWYRDVPLGGSPKAMLSLLQEGDFLAGSRNKEFPNLVSAYFLKWILDGLISVEKDLGKQDRYNLRFTKGKEQVQFQDSMEATIYKAALEAAGDNLLLEANEFKRWSYRHDAQVASWPNEAVYSGRALWKGVSQEDRCHAVEFKNFLDDFTMVDKRTAPEVGLWKQYMILAASFGIAEKVAKNFEKLFPTVMEEYTRQSNMMNMTTTYYLLNSLGNSSRAMMSSALGRQAERSARAAAARRSAGGGGSISFGGGGGGFGGGHGGGSR